MTEEAKQANGAEKPQPAHKYVEGRYVDMEIFDDYVLICGQKMERKGEWNVDVPTWRNQMEFLRSKLAARGNLETTHMHDSDLNMFQKMVDSSHEPDDMDEYRKRMLRPLARPGSKKK